MVLILSICNIKGESANMNIIDKIFKKEYNSIYSIMKRCTCEGKLDTEKFDELINPLEEGNVKINSAFLDQFGIDEEKRNEQVPKILKIIEMIYNDKISFKDIEKRLKEIDFKTLNIIDQLRENLNSDNYNINTYETFKKLMFVTKDKEIFKFSIEMTAIIGKCEELIDDYTLIGQYEEFSKYISFILCIWKEKTVFLEGLFKLLDDSSDWGAINYGEMLMADKEIMADIKNQRRILIGTLSNNCIAMEVAFELASCLNLEELSKISHKDRDLSEAFVNLYYALFFERQPCGGILDVNNPLKYMEYYLRCVKYSQFKELNFIGIKNIYEFLNDDENKNEIIEQYGLENIR